MKYLSRIAAGGCILLSISCGTYFNQPIDFTEARHGEISPVTERLRALPPPKEPIVVGVYNFRDLTGQYKASEVGSTFSTAVTQGATAILIEALEDSKWFTAIERENIGNLLNERNIIRSTRQEYQAGNENQPQVPPLLYAGVLLEGGIISYDYNIITGGMGARYFGVGGSTQYRQDRITIYLRAVSTSSGKILKNVYVSKTILSQAVDANLYRYVNFQRLLEAEVGFTRNEPVQLAVKEAIEKAVENLIIEGIEEELWEPEDETLAEGLLDNYMVEEASADLSRLYNRNYVERNASGYLGINSGVSILSGDYSEKPPGYMAGLEFDFPLSSFFSIRSSAEFFSLRNNNSFNENFIGAGVDLKYNVLPFDKLNPYLYAGPGYIFSMASDAPADISTGFFKAHYGGGLEYLVSPGIGLKIFGEHNFVFSDELDFRVNGKRDDHYFLIGAGVNIYFGNNRNNQTKN
ncbi:CsgG/HfaB family protein [Salinimicrobium terrae]|uniref:CsgG/HfaB family protein n=1 Tax=Salinimicrobium terrae TaxID=470866 RepID=UPI0003FEB1F5|nr:CsgG/HfaB family protein [Salinimicrobium terrae]